MILAKNSNGRQTNSEDKPGRAGLVLGWMTTLISHYVFFPLGPVVQSRIKLI